MATQWFIVENGTKTGPLNHVQILGLIKGGSIDRSTPLMRDDKPAESAERFFADTFARLDRKPDRRLLVAGFTVVLVGAFLVFRNSSSNDTKSTAELPVVAKAESLTKERIVFVNGPAAPAPNLMPQDRGSTPAELQIQGQVKQYNQPAQIIYDEPNDRKGQEEYERSRRQAELTTAAQIELAKIDSTVASIRDRMKTLKAEYDFFVSQRASLTGFAQESNILANQSTAQVFDLEKQIQTMERSAFAFTVEGQETLTALRVKQEQVNNNLAFYQAEVVRLNTLGTDNGNKIEERLAEYNALQGQLEELYFRAQRVMKKLK